jgi:hypothetical protein
MDVSKKHTANIDSVFTTFLQITILKNLVHLLINPKNQAFSFDATE